MGVRRAGVVALLLAASTACSEPFVAPTTMEECYGAGREQRGSHSADVDSDWTVTYSEEQRPLGSSTTVFLCVPDDRRGRFTTDPPPGVKVDRTSIDVGDGTDLPVPRLEVTVTDATEERLSIAYRHAGGGGTASIAITVDDGQWSFEGR
ncbi:hypothetical protein IEZ26_08065 [Nocardioides cavernae]|uniref:Lipoprotein n=1 Tax=Nocardioides cavernae TaxID=1921566 RepID=A0ABR8NBJ7_9ACTN|nr:hypothetical protein [Nocardioides cavernae]MBD3924570.1 hypothetical protein [Nocardioides cavernae]MBM7510481.1 hypothetical protein [Nocardioides cavernae]